MCRKTTPPVTDSIARRNLVVEHQLDITVDVVPPFLLPLGSARVLSVENEDGPYSIGLNSNSQGFTADSVLALPSKAAGWTDSSRIASPASRAARNSLTSSTSSGDVALRRYSRGLLTSHIEILQLFETFLKFKAEIGSRLRILVHDNHDLINSVSRTLINHMGNLHSFTVGGIRFLRRLLEFANSLFGQWQPSPPYSPEGKSRSRRSYVSENRPADVQDFINNVYSLVQVKCETFVRLYGSLPLECYPLYNNRK